MTNDTLQLVIIILLLVVLILILGLGILLFRHLTKDKSPKLSTPLTPIPREEKPSIEEGGFCDIHPGRQSVGICNICEKECCHECLKEIDHLNLCPTHFKEYLENEWVAITNERTSAEEPEKGVYIYNFKKELWDKEEVSSFIQSHYKIQVETDEIETYVKLHVKKTDEENLIKRLQEYKDQKKWPAH